MLFYDKCQEDSMAKEIAFSPRRLKKKSSFVEYPNRRPGTGGIHLDTLRYGLLEQYLPAGGR
jgi:hypothetical protein